MRLGKKNMGKKGLGKIIVLGIAASWAGMHVVASGQEATTQPDEKATRVRIIAPYNLLSDLTDDQKSQIESIHRAELQDEKKLRDKEQTDIAAVLTDDQKKELSDAQAKESITRRATAEERRAQAEADRAKALRDEAGMGASTQPSH
jgi:hypothetical protein